MAPLLFFPRTARPHRCPCHALAREWSCDGTELALELSRSGLTLTLHDTAFKQREGQDMGLAAMAPEADTAGYVVFKLGGAGVLIGIAVGVATGGGPAVESWLAYSVSVAVAGALIGSLAWLRRSAGGREARCGTDDRAAADGSTVSRRHDNSTTAPRLGVPVLSQNHPLTARGRPALARQMGRGARAQSSLAAGPCCFDQFPARPAISSSASTATCASTWRARSSSAASTDGPCARPDGGTPRSSRKRLRKLSLAKTPCR